MSHVKSLKCRECNSKYAIDPINACEFCFGPLEVEYDYDSIRNTVTKKSIESGPNTIWRYHDFLPVDKEVADVFGQIFVHIDIDSPMLLGGA